MRRAPIAVALAVVVVTGCDDADSIPVQPSRTASALTLSAFPTTVLRSGSDVRVTARVTDEHGGLIEGTTVNFSTTSGTLTPSAATTSSSGTASATLSASDVARVTASLASGASAAIDLPAVAPFTIAIDRPSTVPVAGATFTVQVTPNGGVVSPPGPALVTINCGFGSTVDVTASRSHQCVFPSAGDFTVEAAAGAANGWTTSERVQVTATTSPSSPSPTNPSAAVSLVAVEIGRQTGRAEWRLSATATVPMARFEFDFGDGAKATKTGEGNGLSAAEQHLYTPPPAANNGCTANATNTKRMSCVIKVTASPKTESLSEVSATQTIDITVN